MTTTITDETDPYNPNDPDQPNERDSALVSLTGPGTVIEGETTTDYTVSIDQPAGDVSSPVTVNFTYTGTAADGTDFTGVSSVVIPAGSNATTFTIDTLDDVLAEGSENFTISIDSIVDTNFEEINANPAQDSVTTTITDNDFAPVGIDDTVDATENTTTSFTSVLGNDTDANNDSLSVSVIRDGSGTEVPVSGPVTFTTALGGSVTFNADGTFDYTAPVRDHDDLDGTSDGSDIDSFEYKASDGTNESDWTTVNINITDTEPTAVDDTQSLSEDAVSLSGNVVTGVNANADTLGADSATVTGAQTNDAGNSEITTGVATALVGTYGTLTIAADGSYNYVLNANAQTLGDSEIGQDVFSYTLKDQDGDFSTASVTFDVIGSNDAPVVGVSTARVSEEGLTGANPDNTGSSDTTDVRIVNGSISISDDDVNDNLTVTLTAPATTIESNGVALTWAGDGTAGNPIIGSAGGQEIIRATIDDAGSYTVTLSGPVDHTAGDNIEGELGFDFGVSVNDGTTTTASTLSVVIEDDSPTTQDNSNVINVQIDTISIQNYQAGWINPVFDNGTGQTSLIDNDTDTLTDEMRWGTPASGSGQSGYDLVDNAALTSSTGAEVHTGELIEFGTFTHNNFPINGDSSTLDSVTLSIQLDVEINGVVNTIDLTVPVEHTETPNNGPDPRDIITLPTNSQTVNIAGQDYVISLEGFQDENGNVVSTILTDENAANTYTLYGQISTVDTLPEISGSVTSSAGADGGTIVWGDLSSDYGTMVGNSDGTYTFELNRETKDSMSSGQTLVEEFTYSITDADGDVSTSTVTITINGNTVDLSTIDELNMVTTDNISEIVSGSVSDNIDYGIGNTGQIDSIEYNGTTYTAAANPAGVTITLDNGGSVQFDFSTGNYTFDNTAGTATEPEVLTVNVSNNLGQSDALILKLSAAGNDAVMPAINYSEDLTSSVAGWGTEVSATPSGMLIQGNETAQKEFDFGSENAGRTVSIAFDLTVENGWEGSGQFIDFFEVDVNGSQIFSDSYDDGTHAYAFDVVLDGDGKFTLTLATDTSASSEDAWIDNFAITAPASTFTVDDSLIGDNSREEQFVINEGDDIDLVNFDDTRDTLDLSGAVSVTQQELDANYDEYIETSIVDADGDGQVDDTRIIIDSNGETTTGGSTTTVDIIDKVLTTPEVGQLIDGIVVGVKYVTSSGLEGYTNDQGQFEYHPGDQVTFSIGNVEIGTLDTDSMSDNSAAFLQDIAGVGLHDLNDEYLENMAVFLQSLDNNSDAYDGIVVTQAMHDAFSDDSFDLATMSEAELVAVLEENGITAVTEAEAMQHVKDMIIQHSGQDVAFDEINSDTVIPTAAPEIIETEKTASDIDKLGNSKKAETVTKEFDFGNDLAGQTVMVSFDVSQRGSQKFESSDLFEVSVNGNQQVSERPDTSKSYEFEVQLDASGKAVIDFTVDSNKKSEFVDIDNIKVVHSSEESVNDVSEYVDDFMSGTDDADIFNITGQDDGTQISDFDLGQDTLDLSEVISDDAQEVEQNSLAEYLDFALVDSDGDGEADDTAITIDSNGEGKQGGDTTTIFIQDNQLSENDIDDLNIDFQND